MKSILLIIVLFWFNNGWSQQLLSDLGLEESCEVFKEKKKGKIDYDRRLKQVNSLDDKVVDVFHVKSSGEIKSTYRGVVDVSYKEEWDIRVKTWAIVVNVKQENKVIAKIPSTIDKNVRIYIVECNNE